MHSCLPSLHHSRCGVVVYPPIMIGLSIFQSGYAENSHGHCDQAQLMVEGVEVLIQNLLQMCRNYGGSKMETVKWRAATRPTASSRKNDVQSILLLASLQSCLYCIKIMCKYNACSLVCAWFTTIIADIYLRKLSHSSNNFSSTSCSGLQFLEYNNDRFKS